MLKYSTVLFIGDYMDRSGALDTLLLDRFDAKGMI